METKTPAIINVAASLAIATMLVLMGAGIKVMITEPKVITNSRVVVMPNDSIIALQQEVAVLREQNKTLTTVADARWQIINNTSKPMELITDSLLVLMHSFKPALDSGKVANEYDRKVRAERYAALNDKVEALIDNRPDIQAIFQEQRTALAEMVTKRDTVYAVLPDERRNFWQRLSFLFNPKRR